MTNMRPVDGTGRTIESDAFFYNDTYEKKQWYLDGSPLSPLNIDIYSAWKDYDGAGVSIGVIDSQIDFRHADLSRAYDTTRDYSFAQETDTVAIDAGHLPYFHGTAVAGVIAAQAGNGFGTVGIASGATLVGLAIDYDATNAVTQIEAALRASAALDVVNNSWSFTGNFDDDFNAHPEYAQALYHAVGEGRGGLGTNVVFAAGNAGGGGTSNYHNFQNSPYTIAVGAVNADGSAAWFTSLGANVLISAGGSEIYTTTLKGRFADYSGTSFAAPAVSAAIGLMLQANADLGYRDVQRILAYSAQREGLADGANFGDGWRTNGADNYNGGGLHFSDAFGYGFLNVHDAVRLAESWTGQQTLANIATVSGSVQVDRELVAGSADHVSARIDIGNAISVEHVQLAMDLRWIDTGDLDVYLTSPEGTTVRMVYDLPGTDRAGGLRNFTLDSVASLGEQSAGSWTIDVYNRNPGATGKDSRPMTGLFEDATLTITGSGGDAANDTYIYTDEFGRLYAGADLAARQVLNDCDGGIDTINAAAVTAACVIDLSGQSRSAIAGVALNLTANCIENAWAGDGDDVLTGSAADNALHGGRGDDVIYFTFGNDTLDGGQGNDRLIINATIGSMTGHVTANGDLALSLRAGETSIVSGMESFVFTDATCSGDELAVILQQSAHIPQTPADDGAPRDTPVAQAPQDYAHRLVGTGDGERIKGTSAADLIDGRGGDDTLLGNGGDDHLLGGGGCDLLKGGAGDDWIDGGAGRDRLYGGAGADTFVFDVAHLDAADIVYDFDAADRILLTGADTGATFDFVRHGASVYLEMHLNGACSEVARIKGVAIDQLTDHGLTMSESDLGLLWA